MKKSLFLSLLAIASLFASCGSDDANETVNGPTDCETAVSVTADAHADYMAATGEDNIAQACVAYKAALQSQKTLCGDANGQLQLLINGLGDCSAPAPVTDGTITVVAGSNPISFDQVTVVKVGTTLQVTGETSAANNYSIYFEVAEGAEGANLFQNFQIQLTSAFHIYEGEGQFQFVSNITNNETGTLTGTFHGYVQNDDNGVIELTQGNISLDY